MAKIIDLDIGNKDEVCKVAKALSSPMRLDILSMLNCRGMIISEIAKQLNIPPSSAALHVKVLEEAGLIMLEEQPGTRGATKLCNRKKDIVHIELVGRPKGISEVVSVEMPVGCFSECQVMPTCGLANAAGIIGYEDITSYFYHPNRVSAGILWSSGGFVKYLFPNLIPKTRQPKTLMVSTELCSEAPGYNENWISDITLKINGCDCGFYRSGGDYGGRRGRLTPETKTIGSTQYGKMVNWRIGANGVFIDDKKVSSVTIDELHIMEHESVEIWIGNQEGIKFSGGFNIFGRGFGDFDQDILMISEYI